MIQKINRFKKIRKKINSRQIRHVASRMPWPYNGMINDILGCIQTCGNYLAAMGLAAYTEICGRLIFYKENKSVKDWECFNKFIEYMGVGVILKKRLNFEGREVFIKDAVRNGLVHEYFMKIKDGTVAMSSSEKEAIETGFIIKEPDRIAMIVIPYFTLFCKALEKAKKEHLI